jgi:gas vesicle protein
VEAGRWYYTSTGVHAGQGVTGQWQNGGMKFRTGAIVGFAIGYVLGAKAGKERYDQIHKVASTIANNPPIRQLIDESKALADKGTTKAREAMSDQLHAVSDQIREATS